MKKVFLCILDGFGLGDENYKYNAVFQAKMPTLRRFLKQYSHSSLKTSGLSVGLPEGQMGNSEVGHMTIGAGRVLMQDLPMISDAIQTGILESHPVLQNAISELKKTGGKLHLLGLASEGGVHSHVSHMHFLANLFAKNGVQVFIHALSDGRDVPPTDFLKNLKNFEEGFADGVKIATLCGRFFTMDRDQKLERTKQGIDLILKAKGEKFDSLESAVQNSYKNEIFDEFIQPAVISDYAGVLNNDLLIFANFRADRARQASEMLDSSNAFKEIITMMEYSENYNFQTLFKKQSLVNTLPEVISKAGLKQFKIAETEKYAHITFFFNGGKEELLEGEERCIIPSPKVKTYDMMPEMSLPLVEQKLLEIIPEKKFDFIACNVANGDMVGHTGNFEAAKKAAERIDEFLLKMEEACLQNNYTMLITADHGNLEEMLDEEGNVHTQHTTTEVPFFVISKERLNTKNGSLANVAPTVLRLLEIEIPKEMEQKTLID